MIIFDGTYRSRAENSQRRAPISQWDRAWHIRIIDLAISYPQVKHLKPIIVIAIPAGSGNHLTSCAESIGRKIRRDFDLQISKVLWIETLQTAPEHFSVANFIPKSTFGHETFYDIEWRPIRLNEAEAIQPFIPEEH
jgi:hypothetical protein